MSDKIRKTWEVKPSLHWTFPNSCQNRAGSLPTRIAFWTQCVHDVFHVSNLKKCLSDDTPAIPLEEIQVDERLNFIEEPIEIMDREVKRLKQSRIPIVKVRWNSRRGPEYTWEREDEIKRKYPHLFSNPPSSVNWHSGRISQLAGETVTNGNLWP